MGTETRKGEQKMTVKTHAGTISAKKDVLVRIANAFYSEAIYYEKKGFTYCSDDSAAVGGEIMQALREEAYFD